GHRDSCMSCLGDRCRYTRRYKALNRRSVRRPSAFKRHFTCGARRFNEPDFELVCTARARLAEYALYLRLKVGHVLQITGGQFGVRSAGHRFNGGGPATTTEHYSGTDCQDRDFSHTLSPSQVNECSPTSLLGRDGTVSRAQERRSQAWLLVVIDLVPPELRVSAARP